MSDRIFDGAATVRRLPERGMITLRGDLGELAAAVSVPEPGNVAGDIAWMSPDELLAMCPPADVEARIAALRQAMAGKHHLV
ncbi:MAG: sarcosine oxidase subunit gamma, partial [Pseudomonadota bacterium]